MITYNCIIVDDEVQSRNLISIYISNMDELNCTGSFESAIQALEFLKNNEVDIIFTDINMPGLLGIDFAKTLTNNEIIIFTTAHLSYALEAFEVEATDYLVKPISREKFSKAVEKAIKQKTINLNHELIKYQNEPFIFLKKNKIQTKVYYNEILYIKSDDDYVLYKTNSDSYMIKKSLKTAFKELNDDTFIQVHKSYIINISLITQVKGSTVFINTLEVPIGRVYKKELQRIIKS